MWQLFTNKNWMLLTAVFLLIYGNYCAVGAVVATITTPYGYDIQNTAMFCLIFLISGILTSFFYGTLLDKY
jgi:hypothetical protein